jgi:aspartate/tyrosine/aromatic aminotransferase
LDADATSIRDFFAMGMCMMVSQSYAKNFGLYGERIGALHLICPNPEVAVNTMS